MQARKQSFFFNFIFGNAGNLTNRKNQRGNLLVKGFFLFAVVFFREREREREREKQKGTTNKKKGQTHEKKRGAFDPP